MRGRQHLHALLLALLCSLLFLRDGVIPGRALVPFEPQLHDVYLEQAIAAGQRPDVAALAGHVGMGDKYFQSLCWDRVAHERLREGAFPHWTRRIGGGAPVVPQMGQPAHPLSALLSVWSPAEWYGVAFLLQQVLFGWFAFVFFRRIGCGQPAALFGVVLAVLGLWLQCRVHHHVVVTAALPFFPMLLMVRDLTRVAPPARRRCVGLLAVATGTSWLSGFAPVSLQATYVCLAFVAVRIVALPAGRRHRAALDVALAMLLAAVISAANMVPILFAYAESARLSRFDDAMLAASGLECAHLLSAVLPDLLASAADRVYPAMPGAAAGDWLLRPPWSQLVLLRQPVHAIDGSSHQVYVETSWSVGAVACSCAWFAFVRRRHRALAAGALVVGALAFALAMASPAAVAVARWIPGMQACDLRRSLFSVAMAITVLAVLGFDGLCEARWRRALLAPATALAAIATTMLVWLGLHGDGERFVSGLCALHGADGGSTADLARQVHAAALPGEIEHNRVHLTTVAVRALAAALAIALAACVRLRWCVVLLAVAAIGELLHAGWGPVRTIAAGRLAAPPAVLQPALAAAANGDLTARRLVRVMPPRSRLDQGLPGNLPGYFGIEDTSFYSALAPQRAVEFFTAIEPDRPDKDDVAYRTAGVGALHDPASLDHPLLDLFGVRFVLTPLPLAARGLVDRTPPGTGRYRLYERPGALPLCTFATVVDVVPDRARRLRLLARRDRDVARRIVLERADAPVPASADATAEFEPIAVRDECIAVRVRATGSGYVRLADPYDEGWRVTVDGRPAELEVADHHLRAVFVPAGEHEVVFRYDAPRVRWPLRVSALALLVAVAMAIRWRRRPT